MAYEGSHGSDILSHDANAGIVMRREARGEHYALFEGCKFIKILLRDAIFEVRNYFSFSFAASADTAYAKCISDICHSHA